MSESEFQIAKLKALLDAYLVVVKMRSEPGEKHVWLYNASEFLRKQIRECLK